MFEKSIYGNRPASSCERRQALQPILIRRLTALLSVLILSTCAVGQKVSSYEDSNFIYRLMLDSALSDDSDNYDCFVKSFSILRRSDNKVIQTIVAPENYFSCDLSKDQIFIIEDVNFDGFNDFRIIQFIPAAPNIPYYYWTFNAETKAFQRDTALEVITSPEFDHNKRLIYSSWRAGWGDYGTSIYKYIKEKATLIEEHEIAPDKNDDTKVVTTIKKLVNGKMKIVERRVGEK